MARHYIFIKVILGILIPFTESPAKTLKYKDINFWGVVGFSYRILDFKYPTRQSADVYWADTWNNAFSTILILGIKKNPVHGFGFGIEWAKWSNLGLDIADRPAVVTINRNRNSSELSQIYFTFKYMHTNIKIGRQEIYSKISPWVRSYRDAAVIVDSFDSIVIENKSVPKTTLIGALFLNRVNVNTVIRLNQSSKNKGIYMFGIKNKSLSNTTSNIFIYYAPDFYFSKGSDTWSFWSVIKRKIGSFNIGLQGAYVNGKMPDGRTTYAFAVKSSSKWNSINLSFVSGYINEGNYRLRVGSNSSFWGTALYGFIMNTGETIGAVRKVAVSQSIIRLNIVYRKKSRRIYSELAYVEYNKNFGNAWGWRIGYRFKFFKSKFNLEYRYVKYNNSPTFARTDIRQLVLIETYLKF